MTDTTAHIYHGPAAYGKIPIDLLEHTWVWKEILYYFEFPDLGVCGAVGIHSTIWDWLVAVERGVDGTIREYRMPTRFLSMMGPEELVAASK